MSILTIVLVILVVGILLWAAQAYIPMNAAISRILQAVVVIALILWLLKVFGLWQYLQNIHV